MNEKLQDVLDRIAATGDNFAENIIIKYYQIELEPEARRLINAHFHASCHHCSQIRKAGCLRQFKDLNFHLELHRKHLGMLCDIVSRGDFTKAFDKTGCGLDNSTLWDRTGATLPYEGMFGLATIDPHNPKLGVNHPLDLLLPKEQ